MAPKSFRILHVTDQHFCNSVFHREKRGKQNAAIPEAEAAKTAQRYFDELRNTLSRLPDSRPPFEAIILGGDFTDQYSTSGFQIAKHWVKLLERYRFAPASNIVLIPGNHDVNLGKHQDSSETLLPVPRHVAEKGYRDLLGDLGPPYSNVGDDLSVIRRISDEGSGQGLIVIGLNSCRVESTYTRGWGYVGMDQIEDAIERIDAGEAGFTAQDGDILVACVHHNPLPLWDVSPGEISKRADSREISFFMDAPGLLTALNAHSFAVLLHGHAHLPRTARLEGYHPDRRNFMNRIVIAGEGSYSQTGCRPHHFAILEIQASECDVFHDRQLWMTHFYADESRTWASPENQQWALGDTGWRGQATLDAGKRFANRRVQDRDQRNIRESWAPLYNRPDDSAERESSPEWRAILEQLAGEVRETLHRMGIKSKTDVSPALIASLIDDIFNEAQDPGDVSGSYLPQFLAWKICRYGRA